MGIKRILVIIIIFVLSIGIGFSDEVRVGSNKPIKTISQAVTKARPGDVIVLESGKYTGRVEFRGEIHFRSESGKTDVIWEGSKKKQEKGTLHIPAGVKGDFTFSGIQFKNVTGSILSTPRQKHHPKLDVEFNNCIFEDSDGIVNGFREIIVKKCQVKKVGRGFRNCREVFVYSSSFTKAGTVFDNCQRVHVERSPINSSATVVSTSERAYFSDMKITNTSNTVFEKVKELKLNSIEMDTGGTIGLEIAGEMNKIKAKSFSNGITVSGRELSVTNGIFSNIKNTVLNGSNKKVRLENIEISFCKIAMSSILDLYAENIKIKNCKKVLVQTAGARFEKVVISDVDQIVFEEVTKLRLEHAQARNGGVFAQKFTGEFEDVTIDNFKQSFVDNNGDLKFEKGTISKIGGPGIDANGYKVNVKNLTISACPTAIINSPHIEADNLTVTGCQTGGIAAETEKSESESEEEKE